MEVDDTSVEVIDYNGDVVFIVGPNAKPVQVHSRTMMRTSPVFNKMLGPNFGEGESLANADTGSGPVEFKLPEDDPGAFILICSAVHGNPLEDMPNSEELLDIAIVADKYDFAKALRFASQCWIQEFSDCTQSDDLWRVLVSAYMLDCAKGFRRTSRQFLVWYAGSCWDLMKLTPWFDTAALLAFAQDKVKKEIEDSVTRFITYGALAGINARCTNCHYHIHSHAMFLDQLRATGFLEGVGKVSLGRQAQVLKSVSTRGRNPLQKKCTGWAQSQGPTSVEEFKEIVQLQLTEVINGVSGLCMLSLKNGVVEGGVPAK